MFVSAPLLKGNCYLEFYGKHLFTFLGSLPLNYVFIFTTIPDF